MGAGYDKSYADASLTDNPYKPYTAHWQVYERLRSSTGITIVEIMAIAPRGVTEGNARTYISNIKRNIRHSPVTVVRRGDRFYLETR